MSTNDGYFREDGVETIDADKASLGNILNREKPTRPLLPQRYYLAIIHQRHKV
jgi:hypothetical protein